MPIRVRRCRSVLPFAAALLWAAAGCDGSSTTAPSGLATVKMTIGSRVYTVEVADDEASREHGLMERDAMEADHGMIFVFPDAKERAFWMHHTRFPLDILYLRADGTVVSVATMLAYDEGTTPSHGAAQYAVELKAGQAAAAGVKAGDKLTLPPGLAAKN
jgi:uncharacterized membrane protein (UPF0127 family)